MILFKNSDLPDPPTLLPSSLLHESFDLCLSPGDSRPAR